MSSAANSAPIPWVVQRPQPTLGPMNPTATPISAHTERQSVSAPRPLTQAGSSMAQARMRPRAATSARTTQPSSGRRMASPRPLIARRPRRAACGGPGRPWRSGTPRARDAGPATAGAGSSSSGRVRRTGSNADASRATTTVLIPRFLSAASGRMNEVSPDGGDDDRGHAPPEASEAGQERLVERRLPVGLHGGQQLEDLEALARAAVRRQHGEPVAADRQPHGTVLAQRLVGDRGRGPDRDLGRGVVAGPRLHRGVEVQEDPGVGGLLEVELLDLDLAEARGRAPVDPVHGVAGRVRAHRGGERRGLERALRRGVGALDAGRWQPPQWQGLDARVDHQRDPLPHPGRGLEEAEGIARSDLERLDAVVPAPLEDRPDQPGPLPAAAERERPPRQPARERGGVVDLEPRLDQPAGVPQRVGDPQPIADVRAQLADRVPGLEVGRGRGA